MNNTKVIILFLILFLSFFCFAKNSFAADLHVGSGQTYSSIASAIAASSSGDNIIIHQGTYNEYNLQPKSGTTLSSAKRFDAETFGSEAMPIIDAQQTEYGGTYTYTIFNLSQKSNVTLDGLDIRNSDRTNVRLTDSGGNTNFLMQYCTLSMTFNGYANDNSSCLRIDPSSTNTGTVQHNTFIISGAGINGVQGFQGNGAWVFKNNVIEINSDASSGKDSTGIFWKHSGTGAVQMVIENNSIHVTGASDANGGIWMINDNVLIKNNLIYGSGIRYALTIGGSQGMSGANNCVITHNTVYGAMRAGVKTEDGDYPENSIWRDNVIVKTNPSTEYSAFNLWVYGSGTHSATEEHNCIYHSGQSTHFRRYGTSYNLTDWRSLGYGNGTVAENPGFANGSGNFSQIADFEIISGGANNGASDGADMGCDISLLGTGISEPPADETPPANPSGLNVS